MARVAVRPVAPSPGVWPAPLAPMARAAVDLLARRPGHTVSVHEATTGGLISAALLAFPGASQYYRNGRVTSTSGVPKWLPDAVVQEIAASRGQTAAEAHRDGKTAAALAMARHTQQELGTTWCLAEAGACGPTFPVPGLSAGFTAICVTGPVERGILVQGPAAADREANMWLFTQAALTLLAECIAATEEPGSAVEAMSGSSGGAENPGAGPDPGDLKADAVILSTDDRYGGVVAEAPPTAGDDPGRFERALDGLLDRWHQQGKRGCWMKVPIQAADVIPLCVRRGFVFHHTRPDYCMLTRWLPGDAEPDKLPAFANTQVGVGGCVLNDRNEVLLVTERVSPIAAGQGLWKVPGGLTNPGESLYDCAVREVFEETGVQAKAESIVCFRHAHRYRFDVDDLYFVALLRCSAGKEAIKIDPQEIGAARWVTAEELETLYANKKIGTMMKHALDCALGRALPITSTRVASLRGPPTDVFSATGTNLPRNPPDP